MKGFMTLKEAACKFEISERRLNTLCLDGRIDGAVKVGNLWLVPDTMKKPEDRRIRSGKYIKQKVE